MDRQGETQRTAKILFQRGSQRRSERRWGGVGGSRVAGVDRGRLTGPWRREGVVGRGVRERR
jgi:hypothetical protein